ncbi:Uncharacterised protein [Acinetobacter baumannii]|nr:Uncharacterised protein [Acinetobacter baumannii]
MRNSSNQARSSGRCGNAARNLSRPLCHRRAITGETGKPSRASSIAGRSSCSNGNLPKRRDSSPQAAGQPGTVTGVQPYSGIRSWPAARTRSRSSRPGARPLASRPCRRPRVQTRAKASPPIPQPVGSTTVSAAAVAIAASMALPPRRNISSPTCAACGCEVATMPRRAWTGERCEA